MLLRNFAQGLCHGLTGEDLVSSRHSTPDKQGHPLIKTSPDSGVRFHCAKKWQSHIYMAHFQELRPSEAYDHSACDERGMGGQGRLKLPGWGVRDGAAALGRRHVGD